MKRRGPEAGFARSLGSGQRVCERRYQRLVTGRGIGCSMSRRDNCYDNAVMESFLAAKFELGKRFESCGDAKMQLFDYIEMF